MGFAETRERLPRLLLALVLASLTVGARPAAEPPRTIRVVMDSDYAPYIFRSDDGRLQGVLIDQWRLWEKKTGIHPEIHAMDWDQALRRMRAGEFDVIDCVVETEARREYFDFAPAYTRVEASIFFREDIPGITGFASLKGFPVGVKAGDQHIDTLKATGVTTVIPFQNYDAMIRAAKQHQIDVFVADVPPALYLLGKAGIAAKFRRSAPIFRDELRRAVQKGDTTILRVVSDGFAAIEPDELKRIDNKWFGQAINRYTRLIAYAGYTAAAALLIIVGLFGWNHMLRKRIQQRTAALLESEQRFRQIAENIHEVFWLTTVEGRQTLYISPTYEAIWEVPVDTLYQDSRSFLTAVHPEDRARVIEAIDKDREDGFEVEYRVVRRDGSIRWIRDRGFPIRNEAGRVYRRAGIAEDITERKLTGEVVKQTENRGRLIIDTMPTMAWRLRPDGALDFVNQYWLDYTGISVEQALADQNDIVHPEDLPRIFEGWLINRAAGRPGEDEMRLRRADGEYRWFLVRTVPFRDEQGNIVHWYGTSTDIEDRKQAEEKLKQSERQLAEGQRMARVGSWDWDPRSGVLTCSDELYRIYGLPPGDPDFYGQVLSSVHPEDRDQVQRMFERSVQHGEPYDRYFRTVALDGSERFFHSIAYIVSDEQGIPLRVLGTTQDVTELKRAEEKLKATSEQLRALSARLQLAREEEGIRIAREIHDELGSTLTSLRWELEGIKTTLIEPGKELPASDLKEKLAAMLGLTDSMIEIVRRIASDLRPVVLDVLGLQEAIEWQAGQFQDRTGIAVHCESAGDIELNAEQSTAIFRIFQEALTNVLRHAQATRVDVKMFGDPGAFVLQIKDNGRGITEDESVGESSIGLLGMRERAHLIGGEVDVIGFEGEGTTVTLRLPTVEA